jgi:molybdate transport system substrate-binding protein
LCLFGVIPTLAGSSQQVLAQAKKELRVAAASDLQPVMPAFADAYEKAKGVKLVVSYGSSATLATQIQNGAPIDIFFSADYSFPEQLVAANLTDAKAPTQYAKGTLVLWARKDSPLQPIDGNSLTDPRLKSLAIADEFHAPYGRAAVAALKWMKLYDTLKPRLVIGENITQAAQYAESGNAQLGLISLTLASTPHFKDAGSYVMIPPTTYPPIIQCAVVIAKSDRKTEAHDFLDWMLSPEQQGRLKDFGLAAVR